MKRLTSICCALLCVVCLSGADWLQFRGPKSSGFVDGSDLPTTWSKSQNIAWKTPLKGRGLSGPIVVGDRVVVTSSSGYGQNRLHVDCFDVKTGDRLWERQFWATGRTMTHPKMCVATPTPVSDGERIFAFYSSNDLACLDLDGNLLWYRGLTHDFPNASNSLGMSSSPIVIGDTLVVQVENDAESFATGVDVATGKARWKRTRTKRANWTSPVALGDSPETALALLQSSAGIEAVVPKTGEVVWTYENGASTIPSSTVSGDTVFIPSNGITAIRPAKDKAKVLWNDNRLSPSTPSPIVKDGRLYIMNRSIVKCADITNGKLIWQARLKGSFSATPVGSGKHLFCFNEEGLGQVVELGETKGTIVGESALNEVVLCTPAIADDALYVRSDGHLWKLAKTGK
ncbi:MAG: pyrrolo-quinoline quinone [Planctomycetaceae bacterium]|nr:pyrrolo-quinoline quinone [Planctomycetaceae bacterium]